MGVEYLGAVEPHRLGALLARELRAGGGWSRLAIVVAFAKMSGVAHVEGPLRQFVAGGGRADVTIGVDMLGTSYEASWYLMNAVAPRGRLLLASGQPAGTFHPKVFVFSDASPSDPNAVRALGGASRALVVVGSSNLTRGGLYVNDEANLVWRPQLSTPQDRAAWISFTRALSPWLGVNGAAIVDRATPERLATLSRGGWLAREIAMTASKAAVEGPSVPARGLRRRSGAVRSRRAPSPPPLTGPPPPPAGPPSAAAPSTPGLSVLIARLSFGASRRWPQWELNTDILRDFFGISLAGTPVPREGVTRVGIRLPSISNPLVIGLGKNRRLEFPEPDGRPDPGRTRLLLVVVDRRPSPFRYAVLYPTDVEYQAVDALNQSSAAVGQHVEGTKRVIVPYGALEAVWPGCPL